MIRLLWKEWHELRWYLAALALGPWLATLLLSSKLGYYRGEAIYSGDLMILLLVLAFWAGTRMPGEMRASRFGVGWLPIKRRKVWLVKFGPGFLAAALFPLWIHLVALYRVHPIQYDESETALMHVAANLACSISIYTCTFAVSMFASSVVAIMCGYALTFIAPGFLLVYAGIPLDMYQTLFSGIALAVGLALWTKGRGAGAVRRAGVAVVAAIPGMALGLLALAVIGLISAGSAPAFRDDVHHVIWRLTQIRTGNQPYDVLPFPQVLPSPDGRFLAYVHSRYDKAGYRGSQIRIRDSQGDVAVLKRSWAFPAAWLPDGRLVVAAGREKRMIHLLEWDPGTDKLRRLAGLPRITGVFPDATGKKIAILATPRGGQARDLWVLDRRSRRVKLLRPGLGVRDWWGHADMRWDGDRLVFHGDFRTGYWSIRADGADFRQVFPSPKEGHGD